jgi:hypothetical protein
MGGRGALACPDFVLIACISTTIQLTNQLEESVMSNRPRTPYQWKQWVEDRERNGQCATLAMTRDEQHLERIREAREAEANFVLSAVLRKPVA